MNDAYLSTRIVHTLRTRSCAPVFTKCSIQHLPAELIVDILSELPARQIVLWRVVSAQFRDVVANSMTLQYKIECCVTDVLEEPPCLTREKKEQVNAMREWSWAWRTADWKMELTEASALAQGISLDRPPSITRRATEKTHDFSDLDQHLGYGYDADANVVVVIMLMQDSETVLLVPLDLATREAHSECIDDAQTMYLRVSPSGSFGAVSVCGHVVMCPTINHDEPGALGTFTEYNCFDWRTGRRLLFIYSASQDHIRMDDFAFLSERFCIIAGHHIHRSFLAVLDLSLTRGDSRNVDEVLHGAVDILGLPRAPTVFWSPVLSVNCQPQRLILPNNYQDALFTPANSSPVIQVHMTFLPFDGGLPRHLDLLIPSRAVWLRQQTVRQFTHHICDKINIPPVSEWCQAARLLEGHPAHTNAVCGSRFVTRETDPESGKPFVAIYDFCPLEAVLRDVGCGEEVDFRFGSVPLEENFPGCVGETAAPYRRVKTSITLEEDEYPQLTEDSIVVVKGSGPDARRTRVYCF